MSRQAPGPNLWKHSGAKKAIFTPRSSGSLTLRRIFGDLRVTRAKVTLNMPKWTMAQKEAALTRVPNKSANAYTSFLRGEFAVMIRKTQWVLLPAALVMTEEELQLSPLGVLPRCDRRPRSIIDYTFYRVNEDMVVMTPP
jgi:hypothetical protein